MLMLLQLRQRLKRGARCLRLTLMRTLTLILLLTRETSVARFSAPLPPEAGQRGKHGFGDWLWGESMLGVHGEINSLPPADNDNPAAPLVHAVARAQPITTLYI